MSSMTDSLISRFFLIVDLMRQQEELQRIEEMRMEQMRRRQEFDTRFNIDSY